jgi:hypothetical protein
VSSYRPCSLFLINCNANLYLPRPKENILVPDVNSCSHPSI